MRIRYILDFQGNKKGDEETESPEKAKRLIYRGIAEIISEKKKKKNDNRR